MQERDDGLAEREALDREYAVPAGVQLVDDDVGLAVELEGLVVREPFDEPKVGIQPVDRGDDVLGSLAAARRRRVDDQRPPLLGARNRRRDWGNALGSSPLRIVTLCQRIAS